MGWKEAIKCTRNSLSMKFQTFSVHKYKKVTNELKNHRKQKRNI